MIFSKKITAILCSVSIFFIHHGFLSQGFISDFMIQNAYSQTPEQACQEMSEQNSRLECLRNVCHNYSTEERRDQCFFETAREETSHLVANDPELEDINHKAKYIGLYGILPLNIIISIVMFIIKDKNNCVWPSELSMTIAGFIQSSYEVVEYWTSTNDLTQLNKKYEKFQNQLESYRYFRDKEKLSFKYILSRLVVQSLSVVILFVSMMYAISEYSDPSGATCVRSQKENEETKNLLDTKATGDSSDDLVNPTSVNNSASAGHAKVSDQGTKSSRNLRPNLSHTGVQTNHNQNSEMDDDRRHTSTNDHFNKNGHSGRASVVLTHGFAFLATMIFLFSLYGRFANKGYWVKYGKKAKLTAFLRAATAGVQFSLIASLNILLGFLLKKVKDRVEELNERICNLGQVSQPSQALPECSVDFWKDMFQVTNIHSHGKKEKNDSVYTLWENFIPNVHADLGKNDKKNSYLIEMPLLCLNQNGGIDAECRCQKEKNCMQFSLSKSPMYHSPLNKDQIFQPLVKKLNDMMSGKKSILDQNPLESLSQMVYFKNLYEKERKKIGSNIPTLGTLMKSQNKDVFSFIEKNKKNKPGIQKNFSYMFKDQEDSGMKKDQWKKFQDDLAKKSLSQKKERSMTEKKIEVPLPSKRYKLDSIQKDKRKKIWDSISHRYQNKLNKPRVPSSTTSP